MLNNFIGNNVTLVTKNFIGQSGSTKFINNRIYNNNNIIINGRRISSNSDNILKNIIIKSNNNINFTYHQKQVRRLVDIAFNLNNLIINSSNNITLKCA